MSKIELIMTLQVFVSSSTGFKAGLQRIELTTTGFIPITSLDTNKRNAETIIFLIHLGLLMTGHRIYKLLKALVNVCNEKNHVKSTPGTSIIIIF